MTEKKTDGQGEHKTNAPEKTGGEVTVPVKINKVIKNLTLEEVSSLAEKGMKFDIIVKDYEKLTALANKRGISVSKLIDIIGEEDVKLRKAQLLEECAGNEKIAEHILNLETKSGENNDDMEELREYYPQFENIEQLPDAVIEAVKLKGTKPLDEYLRYCLQEERVRKEHEKNRRAAEDSGIGPQHRTGAAKDPVNAEFLRGIWNK